MPISVNCPNGHALKIKDKFAGMMGLCPHCKAKVQVPALVRSSAAEDMVAEMLRHTPVEKDEEDTHASLQDSGDTTTISQTSLMPRRRSCPKCRTDVSNNYRICPKCNTYFADTSAEISRPALTTVCAICSNPLAPGSVHCNVCGADARMHH